MSLGPIQPLTEMSTRNIFGGKGGRCLRLKILTLSCANLLETLEPETPGTLRACPWIALPLPALLAELEKEMLHIAPM